jgi:lambda repressor-like predicted transcriptional regulator
MLPVTSDGKLFSVMPMSPNDRKAELVRKAQTMTDIARQLGVSVSHVAQVVAGKRRSPSVERAVSEAIGKPVERVFGSAA